MLKGALSLAECMPAYKVDCTLILHNSRQKRDFVLRTTLDSLSVWKIKVKYLFHLTERQLVLLLKMQQS